MLVLNEPPRSVYESDNGGGRRLVSGHVLRDRAITPGLRFGPWFPRRSMFLHDGRGAADPLARCHVLDSQI
jgi:hypothetical protein